MKGTTAITIDVGRESVNKAAERLRKALEGCKDGTFALGDFSEHGLLAELIADMRVERPATVYREASA